MAEFIYWFESNWSNFIAGTVAILSLLITVATFRQAADKADAEEYAMLAQQHQIIWVEARSRVDLGRILSPEVDLKEEPLTAAENAFLNQVFVHFEGGWKLARKNTTLTLKTYTADVRKFFSFPVVRAAWEYSKTARNPEFVKFVQGTIEARHDFE